MKGNAGFTFLEVMIAFSIIALVLVGIYQLQSQNIALGAHARFNATAPMLAQEKAAEIISDPEDLSATGSGDFGDLFKGYEWRSEIEEVTSDFFEETESRLKRIDIYVSSKDHGGEYHLRTYCFFDEE